MNYTEYRKQKQKEKNKINSNENIQSSVNNYTEYRKQKQKKQIEDSINFNTLSTDLQSATTAIGNAYGGWQTQETMANTKALTQSVYDRLGQYQAYQKKYGGADLSEIYTALGEALGDWDKLSSTYGKFKSAESYGAASKVLSMDNKYSGLTFDQVQGEKSKYDPNSFEYKYFDNYTGYKDLREFDKALNEKNNPVRTASNSKNGTRLEDFNLADTVRQTSFLDSVNQGYVGGDMFKPTSEIPMYYENQILKGRDLSAERNKFAIEHKADLYKDVMANEDYAQTSAYVPLEGGNDLWKKHITGYNKSGYRDLVYEYVNGNIRNKSNESAASAAYDSILYKNYELLNDEERGIFNYLYNQDRKNGTNSSIEFLEDMQITLDSRKYRGQTEQWKEWSKSPTGAALNSIASIPANIAGAIPTGIDAVLDIVKGNPYNPYSSGKMLTNYAMDTRQYVGQTIAESTEDWDLLGQNIPQFLYQTGMSIGDNLLGAGVFGGAYTALMGTSAFQTKAKEMVEAGEDNATIYGSALASAAAEILFEKISLDSFLKIKGVDSKKALVKTALKQAGVEASEEFFTEVSNILTDNWIRGEGSDIKKKYNDLLARGFSETEASKEIAKDVIGQVSWAAIGGAISGAVMGSAGSIKNYAQNSLTGRTIQGNARVEDLVDMVSSKPELSEANQLLRGYTDKGVNSENISNAQVGNLFNTARGDISRTISSKDSTTEQRQGAMANSLELASAMTSNDKRKEVRETYKIGSETKYNKTNEGINIKSLEIKDGEVTSKTSKGDIKESDITFALKDAEVLQYAKDIANDYGETIGNLFIQEYDGKSNVEAFANRFNLALAYAKNNYSIDTILSKKGELSTDTVKAIYTEARTKVDQEHQAKIDALNREMAEKGEYKGFINDSAITKEVWAKLDNRQKQAVTFIKGFAQATGMNLILTYNPNSKTGGAFNATKNTITIDVSAYATKDVAKVLKETIIPTMSHEVTHWMRKKSPKLWQDLNNLVFETLQLNDGINEVDRIAVEIERIKRRRNDGKEVSEDEAREEIIARACEDMLSMSKEGRKYFDSLSETEKKTFVDKIKEIIEGLKDWVSKLLSQYKSDSYEAKALRNYQDRLNEISEIWDKMLVESVKANQSLEKSGEFGREVKAVSESKTVNEVKAVSDEKVDTESGFYAIGDLMDVLSEAVNEDGEQLFQYKAMEEDEEIYREMLLEHRETIGITPKQIEELFTLIDKAVGIIKNNLDELDYAWESDIDDRAFSPVKQNSDSLYKVSLDFSTLCRKRLLQQIIQATLQEALNKPLSKEEGIAIRDELMKLQKEGRQIEVACALCYVESARMKSPEQIKRFLDNREAVIKDFFAGRSGGSIKEKVKNAETKAREELKKKYPKVMPGKNGAKLDAMTAKLNQMLKDDAEYIRSKKKEARASYKLTEQEQAELETAMKLSVSDFTSAKGLENLAKNHSDIFDAYTSYIRNATHSKGLENDVWWRAGDADAIGDNLIKQMNEENGLRSQSWSDFQVIHLLDYIAATIELSTKGAKRQSYTKVPDYVKLLGNTGDMINMSVIPSSEFSGKLEYDDVEGMAYKVAVELRERYHKTAGIICIGMDDAQIRLLLEDINIDMVIPYHSSSMSKDTRKLMHIPAWKDYQSYQGEKKLKDEDAKARAEEYGVELKKDDNWQKAPKFSEWFDLTEARQIAKMENAHPSDEEAHKKYGKMYGGYMAMQNAANTYLKLCAERGLAPKFSNQKADYTKDANYWKLLIDRKMVDNVTGEIIEQKPIKPIFDEQSVLEILDDELERYPQVKADQEYAERVVVQKFLSGEMQVDKSTLEAIQKPVDNITEVNILESSRDLAGDEVLNADRNLEDTSVYDLMGEADRLRKENAKIKADIEALQEALAFEKNLTGGNYFNEKQLGSVANVLKKRFDSTYDKVELMKGLRDVYRFISTSEQLTWGDVYARCYALADKVLDEVRPKVQVNEYYKDILRNLRGTRISFSETQKAEAKNQFGSHWNRSFMGSIIVSGDGIPLDSIWQEWADLYPGVGFEEVVSDADMPSKLYDVISSLREGVEKIEEYNKTEDVRALALEIYNQYWNVSFVKTEAEKYDHRLTKLKLKHKEAMAELREEYKRRMDEQIKEHKIFEQIMLDKAKKDIEAQKKADDMYYGRIVLEKDKMNKRDIEARKKLDDMYYGRLIRRILIEKTQAVDKARNLGWERYEKYKSNAEIRTVLQSTIGAAMTLNRKLITNSKDVHIPDSLKPVVINLLNTIDFSSKKLSEKGEATRSDIERDKALSKVRSMVAEPVNIVVLRKAIDDAKQKLFDKSKEVLGGVAMEEDESLVALNTDLIEDIGKMIEYLDKLAIDGVVNLKLQDMNLENLRTLNKMVRSINHWAVVSDKVLANKHKKRVSDLAMQTVEESNELGERQEYRNWIEATKSHFTWRNLLPIYAFERLGGAAKEIFYSMMDAQDKVTFNRQAVIDFTDELLKKHKDAKKWRNEIKEFDLKLPNGDEKHIKIPVTYLMSLYCVAKRQASKNHLYGLDPDGKKLDSYADKEGNKHEGGGITIKGFNEKGLKVSKSLENTILNEDIVSQLIGVLTEEQTEVADEIQKYMQETGGKWGNEVSEILYGIRKFDEENYFPMTVTPHSVAGDVTKEKGENLFSILNYGFTKELQPGANQSLEISDIFDVFANHMNMTAIYNAYALPVYDMARWFRYRTKDDKGNEINVRTSIENAFGKYANTYISDFISDLNAQHESSRLGIIETFFRNTKVAMVGNSISVALLQPTAYIKAMVAISPKHLMKSLLYVKDFGARRGVERAKKYCGIALLKSQGYFETGVSTSITKKMIRDENVHDKVLNWSLKGAELADERTWGVLWNACEFEIREKRKDLKVGTPEYFEAVAEKLREVVYKTQVVDSPLTKSDLAKSPDNKAKEITMFISEPTVAYNMVFESLYKLVLDRKKYGKNEAWKRNAKNIVMTFTAYTLTSFASGFMQALVQAFRKGFKKDEEDESTFAMSVFSNFIGDWFILGKIPYVKDAISLAQGYTSSRTETLWLDSAFKAVEMWNKAKGYEEKAKDQTGDYRLKTLQSQAWAISSMWDNILKTFSYLSGVAIYNQWRDLRGLLRTLGLIED